MRALSLLLLVASAVGCGVTHEPAVMRIDGVCLKTACDVKPRRDWCSECLSACAASRASCNPDTACSASCSGSSTSCTEAERTRCVEKRFTAYVPLHGDPAIEEACRRAMNRHVACGSKLSTSVDSFCAAASRVAVPEVVGVLTCVADLPCGADDSVCPGLPAPAGVDVFEADACARLHPATSLVTSGGYKPDVVDAARRCLAEPNCTDVRLCLDAWLDAVRAF